MSRTIDAGGQLDADVAIVGAGLAGLVAARTVAAAGLVPVVLEARDRVGGRTASEHIGEGAIVEMGGQYLPHTDERLPALLAQLGIDTFPVYDRGAHLLELGRGVRAYRGKLPAVRPRTLLDLGRARWQLDRRAKKVPARTPWEAPAAREWDATSIGAWLDANVRTPEGRALLHTAFTTIWGEDPDAINLLGALTRVHEAGGFDKLTGTRGGGLEGRVVGGPTRVAETIAAGLDVRCGHPVDAIVDRGSSVVVEAGPSRVLARRVIVAVPPVLARRIRFEPGLPDARRRALDSLPAGSVIKVAAVYERPFWRERGLSGRALTADGPVTTTFDNSPPDGTPGVLIGFVPGSRARALATRPAPERREAVLGTFTRLFGTAAARPELYLEKDWTADPWSRGCYHGLPAPRAITELLPAFATPTGLVHWAGSETTFRSFGGMDGAVISGERAGREVVAALAAGVEAVAVG